MNSSIDKIIKNLHEIICTLEEFKVTQNEKSSHGITSPSIPSVRDKFLTVEQFVSKHQCFTIGGVRSYLFFEDTNGLKKSGAIVRIGRKILIDEEKFFNWIRNAPSSS
jgi:hypothetical protein